MPSKFSALLLSLILFTACKAQTSPVLAPEAAVAPPASTSSEPPPPPLPPLGYTEVLMINGGGSAWINSQSHLLHLTHLRDLLAHAGVPADRLAIFASDGADPNADLAVRETQPEPDFWRLKGTHLEQRLQTPTTLINSALPGATLRTATKAGLTEWFGQAAQRLKSGDTLLVYVTDHGTRPGGDSQNNRILLWGPDEYITVRELSALFAMFKPGVRVVSLMSQCYSGAFADTMWSQMNASAPSGNVCGYFSSTADRKAYGCYTENMGKDNIGHSFEFFRALERNGAFDAAHESVLVSDATPDVPLRTSDMYLQALLMTLANSRNTNMDTVADELLKQAFADAHTWEHETRLLDRISQAYGNFSPRALAELRDLATRLPEIDVQLTNVKNAWEQALGDANQSRLDWFTAQHPPWQQRLTDATAGNLVPAQARGITAELLPLLAQHTATEPALAAQQEALHMRGEAADDASYRMQVRLAVVLRLRTVLLTIAGRYYLQTAGTPEQRAAYQSLTQCEGFTLPLRSTTPPEAPAASSYPPFEDDVKLTLSALPGWIGISFKEPNQESVRKYQLPPGASEVQVVYPNSPAAAAGFAAGDLVLGPAGGAEFLSKNQIRAWTMLAAVGKPGNLTIIRGGKRLPISIVPAPYPVKWPELPGPVQIGAAAPDTPLKAYRGPVQAHLGKHKQHLLFFWATWCGPCKLSIPELLAYEKEKKVPVVAVTDENSAVIDGFLKKFTGKLPNAIAMDEGRKNFMSYGVSGTPTFVLIDDKGNVTWRQVGYNPRQGLSIPGWTWSGLKKDPPPPAAPAATPPAAPAPQAPAPSGAPGH
jgi:thiol-disulfide isomerase/thioredoxin